MDWLGLNIERALLEKCGWLITTTIIPVILTWKMDSSPIFGSLLLQSPESIGIHGAFFRIYSMDWLVTLKLEPHGGFQGTPLSLAGWFTSWNDLGIKKPFQEPWVQWLMIMVNDDGCYMVNDDGYYVVNDISIIFYVLSMGDLQDPN